ncbi:MAG: beta-lactamase family protein [Clostridia bacterium]|nr:beta-lactamase family protein [Clostridia bacterium]
MDFTYLKEFMDLMARERTPGCAAQIYVGGNRVFRYEAGYASLEDNTTLTGTEHFNIYSCSKITTCTAGAQLLERGKFLLTDPLYDYIPEFRHMAIKQPDGSLTDAKKPITIGDLFSMTAGFTYDTSTPAFEKARQLTDGKMDTLTVIRCLAEEPLAFEPGEKWQYSLCHDVLAGLVEVVSGMKFRDYVDANIFEPLGMTRTVYHHTPAIVNNMAQQYRFVADGEDTANFNLVEAQKHGNATSGTFINVGKNRNHVFGPEYDSGGAGITTTVSDYIKVLAALANNGMGLTGERILSPNTVELMKTNRLTEQQRAYMTWKQLAGYGYGLGVRTFIDKTIGHTCNIGEFGWGGAAGATAMMDTKENLAVFFVQHTLNPREEWYMPRLRNIVYTCLGR